IGERSLHEALTVVECPVDGQGRHTGTTGDELLFLYGTDASCGEQYRDPDARKAGESVSNGSAGIARDRYQHRRPPACPGEGTIEQKGHGPCADVLEGSSRTVEQLEEVARAGQFGNRQREVEGPREQV